MRRLENYVRKYGPKLYHALQSQAAHAGVSARLCRKLDVLAGKVPAPTAAPRVGERPVAESLPLFPEDGGRQETRETAGLVAACA